MRKPFDDWFTIPEAARFIGITASRLRQMIRAHEVKAAAFGEGPFYLINKSEIKRVRDLPRTPGRPRISDPSRPKKQKPRVA
jgi:excisionase family DNA binding protein